MTIADTYNQILGALVDYHRGPVPVIDCFTIAKLLSSSVSCSADFGAECWADFHFADGSTVTIGLSEAT